MNSVCVFCGSSNGAQPIYREAAWHFGLLIAQADLTLVYGGASVGLMGAVADGALSVGGRVIGVMPHLLKSKEIHHRELTELHIVDGMHERKAKMAALADAFVALPGGAGTLEEFFEVWTWAQLGYHQKPCALLNVNGYYDGIAQFLHHAVDERFIKHDHVEMVIVESNASTLLERCRHDQPVIQPKWITPNTNQPR